MDKSTYVVLTPYIGNRLALHLKCMHKLFADGVQLLEIDGCPYIDMAQALLVESALEQTKADYFMFIEHDMVFKPQDVEKLISHLRDSEYDALGAAYPIKGFNHEHMIGKPINTEGKSLTFYEPGLWPAYFLGFGFTVIRRTVFERLAKTLPCVPCPSVQRDIHPFFMHDISAIADGPLMYNGNDVAFFNRMTNLGMKIGIDLEICVEHIGSCSYRLEDIALKIPRYTSLQMNFE
jgi:Glycosyl transferase family 2